MGNHGNNIKNEKINQKKEIKPINNNKLILIKDKIEMKPILTNRYIDYLFLLKDKRLIVSLDKEINIYNKELLEIDLTINKNEVFLQKIAQLKDEKVLFLYNRSICILRINKNFFSVSQYITLFNVIDTFQIEYDDLYIGTKNDIIKYQKDETIFQIQSSYNIKNYKYSCICYTDNSIIAFPDLNTNNIIFLELNSFYEKICYYGKKIKPKSKICKIDKYVIFINFTTFSIIDIDNMQIQTNINTLFEFYSICSLNENYLIFGGENSIFVYEKGIDEWNYKEERNIMDKFNEEVKVEFIIKTNSGKIIFTDNMRIRILQ